MVLLLAVLAVLGVIDALGEEWLWVRSQPVPFLLILVVVPLVVFGGLYVVLGRGALRRGLRDEPPDVAATSFLAILLVVLFAATFTVPIYAVLQTIAYPLAWVTLLRRRDAVLWSAGIALAAGGGIAVGLARFDLGLALASAVPTVVFSFAFAVAMGSWITGLAAQGERYRALAEQLRVSQAEVAELSATAGAAAERERLSRELHDTLTQTLTGLVMLGEQAERALEAGDTKRARERLDRVGSAAREAVAEARALVATTQPLGSGGLEAAIQRVAVRLAEDTGMRVECALETVPMDRERQVVLLRAAQEGLANARKHARAKHVVVSLARAVEGGIVLCVDDDGTGPGEASERDGGFGLSGLADRARAVGGSVDFGSRHGGGSRLELRLPAAQEGAE